jgi:hypothetical protein
MGSRMEYFYHGIFDICKQISKKEEISHRGPKKG